MEGVTHQLSYLELETIIDEGDLIDKMASISITKEMSRIISLHGISATLLDLLVKVGNCLLDRRGNSATPG